MTNIAYPPPRPLSVGEVLDYAFRIYRSTFLGCLVFAGLAMIVNWLPNLTRLVRGESLPQSMFTPGKGFLVPLLMIVAALASMAFSSAVVLRQYRVVAGEPVGGEFMAGVRRIPGIFFLFILYFVVFLVCMLICAPAFFVSGWLKIVAFLVLLIPTLYVLVRVSCAYTALLVVPTGAVDSFERSWSLTRGSFWRLTAIYTIGLLILGVVYVIASMVGGLLIGLVGRGDVAVVGATMAVILLIIGAFVTPFYSALGLAVFGDLSARREGSDLEQRIAAAT